MSNDHNPFGGKNPHGLYVPMSEDEQEVIQRLIETKDLILVIHGWAVLENPNIIFGDLRVGVKFRLNFNGPEKPTPLPYLDLELRRANGQTIFREKKNIFPSPTVCAGVFLDFQWDIAIDHMSPAFVKSIKPGAIGLTSRRIDRDTGERSETGTMHLDTDKKKLLKIVDQAAADIRKEDAEDLSKIED